MSIGNGKKNRVSDLDCAYGCVISGVVGLALWLVVLVLLLALA